MKVMTALAASLLALAPRTSLAQPGPNDPVSQGSTGEASEEGRRDGRLRDEDGSPGRGLVFERGDGDFAVNVRTRIQARATAGGSALDEATERLAVGPSIARARLVVQGYAKKVWLYRVQLGAAPADLSGDPSSPLLDAHVTWAELRDLRVRVGQMQVPFDRQNLISATSLQTVERSLLSNEFALGRDVGVLLLSNDLFGLERRVTYAAGVFGGSGANELAGGNGPLVVGRVELTPLGDFDAGVEADLERRRRLRFAVAVAAARRWGSDGVRPSGAERLAQRDDFTHGALDAKLKWHGVSALVQLHTRRADDAAVSSSEGAFAPVGALGYFVQAGWMVTNELELAARWGAARARATSDSLRESVGAASYYVSGNDIKLQVEGVRVSGGRCAPACTQVRLQVQMSL